jgi:hypothetical protein
MNFSFFPMSAICGAHFILDLIPRYYYASSTNHEAPHYAIFSVLPLLPHTLPHIRQLADGISPQRLKFDPRPTHMGCGVQSGTGTRFLYKPFGLPLSLSFHPGFIPISIYLQPTLVAPCSRTHTIAVFPSAIRIFGGNLPPLYSSICFS